ncbi:2,3-diaminopropionate biosynthesis protein SbnA [Streptomyces demainii]|uniref:Cysteine synthase A n=1 Tax=Streptomyces demainii TaxID=588122 RepID=A0ABT9L6W7_9ACTN|nr:2,3-diaminopropionate biosynthesis protein SbnA [Streptomyces demainii]MDP9616455.1 cysteine synthase A [Streptomyces demainii]
MIYERSTDVLHGEVFVELIGFEPGFRTHLKLEGLNPAGSIKLKTARGLLDSAERAGLAGADTRLIESTSGNLGIALASLCAIKGYDITLVTDPNANPRSVRYMKALGADVVIVRERDDNGGYLRTRIDYIRRRLARDPSLHWLNQYANPANARAHSEGTAQEILRGFGTPDWLFVGVGTSGTLTGCVEHFRQARALTKIVAVDTEGSVTFGGAAGVRRIPGLGTSRRPEIFQDSGDFRKMLVPEPETIRTCRRVARDHGLLVGGSTGTVLAAVRAARDLIPAGSRVLAISPDMGDRYLDTVYDDEWVISRYGPGALHEEAELRGRTPELPELLVRP